MIILNFLIVNIGTSTLAFLFIFARLIRTSNLQAVMTIKYADVACIFYDTIKMSIYMLYQWESRNIYLNHAEDEANSERLPTKKNIQSSLKWLVEGCTGGESLVFYFSGHGLRQPDFAMDEVDGYDETICPVDFMEEGMISDNEINATIVAPLKNAVVLHAIVDACHSGTILDLAYIYDHKRYSNFIHAWIFVN